MECKRRKVDTATDLKTSVHPKIGLMGVGRIGKLHLNALSQIPGFEVAVLVDPLNTEMELPPGTVKVSSLSDALKATKSLDGLVIATPTTKHAEHLLEAITLKIPVVFVEKPISQTLDEIVPIRAALAETNHFTEVIMGFNRRHDICWRNLRQELAKEKESQGVCCVQIISYDKDPPTKQQTTQCNAQSAFTKEMGSIFLDFSIHDLDNIRFVAGEDFDVERVLHKRVPETEEEETVIILRGRSSGCRGVIENSRNCGYGHDQRGTVVLSSGKALHTSCPDKMYPIWMERYAASYKAQVRHFYERACSRVSGQNLQDINAASFEDGVEALRMALDCERLTAH